jgi:hypothetical protein
VPLLPKASSNAKMTATAPPHTHPIELREEWTSKIIPLVTPRLTRSEAIESMVLGLEIA